MCNNDVTTICMLSPVHIRYKIVHQESVGINAIWLIMYTSQRFSLNQNLLFSVIASNIEIDYEKLSELTALISFF